MKNIRLLLVMRSLDAHEFKKLEEMVHTPYFNSSEKCKELFNILKPFYPNFNDERLTKEWLFFSLFPEKEKMTSTLNTLMSKLEDLAEKHLVYQELDNRFLYKRHLLLKCQLQKGLHKHFQSNYKETKSRFANMKKRDSMHFLEQFLIETEHHKFLRTNVGRDNISNPKTLSQYIDSYYWIQKLNLACEIETYNDITSSKHSNENELIRLNIVENKDEIYINENFPKDHISLLFRNMLRCIQQPQNEEIFDEFLTLFLNTDSKAVDKNEYNEFFIHSINYCIDKIIDGKEAYRNKLFELYKLTVDFELIYANGYLNLNRVKNIISCAAQVGELGWAEEFLETYKSKIHPDQYNSAYHFYKAVIYFYTHKYDDAIGCLNNIETDIDKYYFLNRSTFLLRCYYEGKSPLAFENHCKTFRANIKRNKKLTTNEKRSYDNFARIAYFIHQYRDGFSKKTKPKLLETIEQAKKISHKQWLLEKLEELK